jgi:hypothetical protein
MFSMVKAAAVVLCCSGWAVAGPVATVQMPAAVETSVAQKANTINVDDSSPQRDGMGRWADRSNSPDGRDRRDDNAGDSDRDGKGDRSARDNRDDGRQRGQGFMSRGHGRMQNNGRERGDMRRDGRRHGESDMQRGGRDGRNSMRGGHGERGFMRGGHGGRGWMQRGRGEQNFMRGGRGRQNFQRGAQNFMHGGQRGQGFVRGGRDGARGEMQVRGGAPQHVATQSKGAALGIAVTNPDAELRSQLDLPDGVGLVVQQVMPNTVAARAGLKQYDVLQKIDDQLVINPEQVEVLIRMHKPGQKMTFTVLRHGKSQELNAASGHTAQRPGSRNGFGFGPGQRSGQHNGQRGFGHFGRPPQPNSRQSTPEPGATPEPGPKAEGMSTPATQPSRSEPQASIPDVLRQFADLFVD